MKSYSLSLLLFSVTILFITTPTVQGMENALMAIGTNNTAVLRGIIKTPEFNINQTGIFNKNLLHYELEKEYPNLDIVNMLVEAGININASDEFQHTPLHYAASKELSHPSNKAILIHLVKKGSNPNSEDEFGTTPFHFAMQNNYDLTILSTFLFYNGNPFQEDKIKRMPLTYLAKDKEAQEIIFNRGKMFQYIQKTAHLKGKAACALLKKHKGNITITNAIIAQRSGTIDTYLATLQTKTPQEQEIYNYEFFKKFVQ